jgi:hypothetical protein
VSNQEAVADVERGPSEATPWHWVVPLALGSALVVLIAQVHGLRSDVDALQSEVAASQVSVVDSSDSVELSQLCALLGAVAEANGVKPAEVFAANEALGDCEAAAVDASTP